MFMTAEHTMRPIHERHKFIQPFIFFCQRLGELLCRCHYKYIKIFLQSTYSLYRPWNRFDFSKKLRGIKVLIYLLGVFFRKGLSDQFAAQILFLQPNPEITLIPIQNLLIRIGDNIIHINSQKRSLIFFLHLTILFIVIFDNQLSTVVSFNSYELKTNAFAVYTYTLQLHSSLHYKLQQSGKNVLFYPIPTSAAPFVFAY